MNWSPKIKPLFFVFLAIMLFTCEKKEYAEILQRPNQRLLSEKEIREIGLRHNLYLEQLFSDFDWSAEFPIKELERRLIQVSKVNNIDIDPSQTIEYFASCDNACALNQFSFDARPYIDKGIEIVRSSGEVSKIVENLDLLQKEAKIKLEKTDDLNQVLVSLEVFKNSSEFWFPIEQGGNGKGSLILSKLGYDGLEKKLSPCVEKVIIADGITVATEFIVGAFVLALASGPVAPAVFFGLVGINAAIDSALAALMSSECNKNLQEEGQNPQ